MKISNYQTIAVYIIVLPIASAALIPASVMPLLKMNRR